jgi:glycine dehydrogenase
MKTDSFALRHLGPRDQDLPKMLETIGVESLDQLTRLFQLTFG